MHPLCVKLAHGLILQEKGEEAGPHLEAAGRLNPRLRSDPAYQAAQHAEALQSHP